MIIIIVITCGQAAAETFSKDVLLLKASAASPAVPDSQVCRCQIVSA